MEQRPVLTSEGSRADCGGARRPTPSPRRGDLAGLPRAENLGDEADHARVRLAGVRPVSQDALAQRRDDENDGQHRRKDDAGDGRVDGRHHEQAGNGGQEHTRQVDEPFRRHFQLAHIAAEAGNGFAG